MRRTTAWTASSTGISGNSSFQLSSKTSWRSGWELTAKGSSSIPAQSIMAGRTASRQVRRSRVGFSNGRWPYLAHLNKYEQHEGWGDQVRLTPLVPPLWYIFASATSSSRLRESRHLHLHLSPHHRLALQRRDHHHRLLGSELDLDARLCSILQEAEWWVLQLQTQTSQLR